MCCWCWSSWRSFAGSKRRFPDEVVPRLEWIGQPLVVRERCRLRRLRVRGDALKELRDGIDSEFPA